METQTKYAEIPKVTKELMKKVVEVKEGKDILQISWLSSARYKPGEGVVILKFDSNLKPYMLQLKEYYTSYRLTNILSLKSRYSLRVFENLKSHEFKKKWQIELNEFKKLIGATEKSYSVYQNVKNRIILQAQKELKEKTDICFDFEEIKTGRKVTSLIFYIKKNKIKSLDKPNISDESATDSDNGVSKIIIDTIKDLVVNVTDEVISNKSALSIYEAACENEEYGDKPLDLIGEVLIYSRKNNIKSNYVGWLIKTLKNYERPFKKENENDINPMKFNNFKAREYDYDVDLYLKLTHL